jgi:hypothetical protein
LTIPQTDQAMIMLVNTLSGIEVTLRS